MCMIRHGRMESGRERCTRGGILLGLVFGLRVRRGVLEGCAERGSRGLNRLGVDIPPLVLYNFPIFVENEGFCDKASMTSDAVLID
jgi:hypothetical protein